MGEEGGGRKSYIRAGLKGKGEKGKKARGEEDLTDKYIRAKGKREKNVEIRKN